MLKTRLMRSDEFMMCYSKSELLSESTLARNQLTRQLWYPNYVLYTDTASSQTVSGNGKISSTASR